MLLTGSIFANRYRVQSLLSDGGMGAVYVVLDERTNKKLALKIMHAQLARDLELRKRFEGEAKVVAKLENDHILDVRDFGVDDESDNPYLVMELLQGEDLDALLERGPLPLAVGAEILPQLFFGMAAAHAVPVVHRDLKPGNIFLHRPHLEDGKFIVKVLDFGIAKDLSVSASTTQAAMGTPLWMAPEQTRAGAVILPSADVWALGLLAFTILTGKIYWLSANGVEADGYQVMREVLFDPLVSASERSAALGLRGMLPQGFDEWFAKTVVRDPAERFPTASHAWEALEKIIAPLRREAGSVALPPMPSHTLVSNASNPASSLSETLTASALTPGTSNGPLSLFGSRVEAELAPRIAKLSPRALLALQAIGGALVLAVVVAIGSFIGRAPVQRATADDVEIEKPTEPKTPGVSPAQTHLGSVIATPSSTGAAAAPHHVANVAVAHTAAALESDAPAASSVDPDQGSTRKGAKVKSPLSKPLHKAVEKKRPEVPVLPAPTSTQAVKPTEPKPSEPIRPATNPDRL